MLELTDLRGQRLLSDDEAGRRSTEVELLSQRDGIADQTKVHRVVMFTVRSWVTHHPPSLESLRCAARVLVTEAESSTPTDPPTGEPTISGDCEATASECWTESFAHD